jgi:Cysteinyl-tRNA synthetase
MKIDKESKTKIKNSLSVFVEEILGLNFTKKSSVHLDVDLIELVKEIRNIERDKKNYELSDLIRDRLNSLGINIEDNK